MSVRFVTCPYTTLCNMPVYVHMYVCTHCSACNIPANFICNLPAHVSMNYVWTWQCVTCRRMSCVTCQYGMLHVCTCSACLYNMHMSVCIHACKWILWQISLQTPPFPHINVSSPVHHFICTFWGPNIINSSGEYQALIFPVRLFICGSTFFQLRLHKSRLKYIWIYEEKKKQI